MKVAIVGATGMVGRVVLEVLAERNFPITELLLVASEKSAGKTLLFKNHPYEVITMEAAIAQKPAIAIFSAGGATSLKYAPLFAAVGTVVIDNSSAWRMDASKKLIVPEVNGHLLTKSDLIIANPNCSTIQMVVALNKLHQAYQIKRIVVSTYQSVTGTGVSGVQQLMEERNGITDGPKAYPHSIDLNCIPHGGTFESNGYTSEEIKLVKETCKILGDDKIGVSATVVRVPVIGGHSESINVSFQKELNLAAAIQVLSNTPGVVLEDNPAKNSYPMPINAKGKNDVFVGRVRMDLTEPNTLNMWVVSDNLRKGAATNAVQIAELLININ